VDQYELYCLADPLFYDRLDQRQNDASDFSLVGRPVPAGWVRHETDTWMYYGLEKSTELPAQGWKIHLSACLDDAERALEVLWDYCVPRKIAFKYLRGTPVLLAYNSKSASRASSGKLATIYPRDEREFEKTLAELGELLRDVRGPYVLSDLRYGTGPLYVRYGGFAERRTAATNGERVLAIQDGSGRLVPDVRGSVFSVPPWTTLPAFLESHLAARNAVTVTDLAYDIESVLHFSNGGGVYLGRAKGGGDQVVLKEGRPHAGLDAIGRDAVTRLRHERDILRRLDGLDVVPRLLDYFTLGEHEFLVQEFVDGNPLQRHIVQRYPLTGADCDNADLDEYTNWAVEVLDRVRTAVAALHERGVVFGDLQPNNIMLTTDGRAVLIDFEVAMLASDDARSALAHPAFVAPAGFSGPDVDRYALACLTLGLFAPQATITLPLHRPQVHRLATLVTEIFPVPAGLIADAVQTIGAEPAQDPPLPGEQSWPDVRAALRTAILASATPDRDDRLFPGDVAQFDPGGGRTFAHGAAGVLWALSVTGAEPPDAGWLAVRATDPPSGSGLGFYDGLHGIAYVLDSLGHRQTALDVLDICLRERWTDLGLDLYGGLAGIGLNFLALGPDFAEPAQRAIEVCADRLGGPEDVPEISGGDNPRAGLLHGSSGAALLFLHAYERSGDKALLDKAADALRQDLRRCVVSRDGSLQVNQGWRHLPYLGEGSVGIALVLSRYLTHRPDEELSGVLADLLKVTRSRYFVQSGLLAGRAGMIAALAMLDRAHPALPGQLRGLHWHALPYADGLAFPGDQLLRLSMDLATGTAGVLVALAAALDDSPVFLPFLEPPGTAPECRGHVETREEV
jgi:predicted Ser/Thr protein kinase